MLQVGATGIDGWIMKEKKNLHEPCRNEDKKD
jgi:hypothetical protein